MMTQGSNFLASADREFRKYKELAEKAVAQLKDDELHWQPNEESNSIAIIIQHISGNLLSRWTDFLTTDGEKPNRQRDYEFVDRQLGREELMQLWQKGWKTLLDVLSRLTEKNLTDQVTIKQQALTVTEAIMRSQSHHCYHVGQILYLAKQIRNTEWKNLSIPKNRSVKFMTGN